MSCKKMCDRLAKGLATEDLMAGFRRIRLVKLQRWRKLVVYADQKNSRLSSAPPGSNCLVQRFKTSREQGKF